MKKIFSILMVALFAGCMVAANSLASETKTVDAKAASSKAKSAEAQPVAAGSEAKSAEAQPVAAGSEAKPAEAPVSTDASLEIIEIAIAKNIENREPQEVADTFASDVERVYCYTKIKGGKEGDSLTHRWKKGDQVIAEVSLKVDASPWRTYSSKAIMQEWTGSWSVEILQGDVVLKTKEFTVQ